MAILLVYVIVYLVFAFPIFWVARRLGEEGAGWAFVPIGNIVVILRAADADAQLGCALFIPIVNFVVYGYLWGLVSERVGLGRPLGWFCAIPLLGWLVSYVVAFGGPGPHDGDYPDDAAYGHAADV